MKEHINEITQIRLSY